MRIFWKEINFEAINLLQKSDINERKQKNINLKKKKKDKTIYKNGQRNMKFDDTEIEEYKFHQYKSPISVSNIDIKKKVVLNMFPFGKQVFKCFIGYKDNKEIILSRNEYI